MPFPLFKLGYLAFRQLSKPINRWIQQKAKASPFVRNYFCIPPAQLYHWYDTRFTKSSLNLAVGTVKKMKEEEAVQLGAEILGEMVIFAICGLVVIYEYRRGYIKDQAKEKSLQERFFHLEKKSREIDIEVDQMDARLRHVERAVGGEGSLVSKIMNSVATLAPNNKQSDKETKGPRSTEERLEHVEHRQVELLVNLNVIDTRLHDLQKEVDVIQTAANSRLVPSLPSLPGKQAENKK